MGERFINRVSEDETVTKEFDNNLRGVLFKNKKKEKDKIGRAHV
jgi:hypothetical protein